MASTYLSLHYHLVFATKNREAVIAPEWRSRMHEYLGGIISGLGGFSQGGGGVADHVHLLVGLKATHCLADVLRENYSTCWPRPELNTIPDISSNRTAVGVGPATPPGSLGWCDREPVVSLRSTTG